MIERKLHIGCGTVYLEGYINIDADPHRWPKPPEHSSDLIQNKTTIDNYYKTPFNDRPRLCIADSKADIFEVGPALGYGLADEVCMFHVLEHLPQCEVTKAIEEIYCLLKPGGRFRVAVPDLDGTVIEYAAKLKDGITEEGKEWYVRLIHGTQRNKWSHHYCGYNKHSLIKLLSPWFHNFIDLPNQNFYPAIHLLAHKKELT